MIYLDDFIDKREGKRIDFDNFAGYQCNDLTRQWLKERGLPQYKALGDNWVKNIAFNPNYFIPKPLKWVKNNQRATNQVPKRGDIIIFSQPSKTGHIAIVVWSTIWLNSIRVFEQNASLGTGTWLYWDACKQRTKTYKYVMWRIDIWH